ncbi:AMP-binding enzyme [Amycolatopsis sp. cmx-4-68]|uniref:AMP-binding enzyme n=1 Tax=Amycolatopsis sp. cmx-4-68 TaxID=2790938 RepID=UPI00397AA49B
MGATAERRRVLSEGDAEAPDVLVADDGPLRIGHPHWIEAVTVPRAGVTFTAAQVIDHAKAHLAGYQCPKYVVFADRLPKNPSGKIVKRELPERHKGLATDG